MATPKKDKVILCVKCNGEILANAKFCNFCGTARPGEPSQEKPAAVITTKQVLPTAPSADPSPLSFILENLQHKTTVTMSDLAVLRQTLDQLPDPQDRGVLAELSKLTANRNKYLTTFVFNELKTRLTPEKYEQLLTAYLATSPLLSIGTLLASLSELPAKISKQIEEYLQQSSAPEKEWYLVKLAKISS